MVSGANHRVFLSPLETIVEIVIETVIPTEGSEDDPGLHIGARDPLAGTWR